MDAADMALLQALDEIDRTVLKLEMERLSLSRPGCVCSVRFGGE